MISEKAEVASVADSADTIYTERVGQRGSFGEPGANAVNIEAAIEEYNEVKRELSRISRTSTGNDRRLEEGQPDEFNLDEFLNGIRNDNEKAGQKSKRLSLIWKDLTVEGLGADAHTIPTVVDNILKVLQPWKLFGVGLGGSKKTILKGISGFCKDGEMLLVLGRPGAGCTTLLKVLGNIRNSYTHIGGEISYGGIDPITFAKRYRGQVVYNEEEDMHYPTLTLRQTLQFALRTKTPGNRLPDETRDDFINKIQYMLGNMLGLSKEMDTLVGNAFLRGLSGGERKRLSIAEVMTTNSSINLWDCSTRGLDAASALDYVRSLRIMTNIFNKTTVATLYQASNNIFSLFDKVLLLDEGYCIYFGPVQQAKSYFEDLGFYCPPRKSIPDFLTGLCNPLEREIKPGFEGKAPEHAQDFQARYYESDIYRSMMSELQAAEEQMHRDEQAKIFEEAVREEHQKRAPKGQPHTSSFYQQVLALTIRQYYLNIKDYNALISRYGTILIQGLITASCFFNIPLSGTGAFSRSGALMFAVIFNTLVSQSELVNFLVGRPILEKHKHFAMYRPAAFYIAQVVVDIPYAIVQVLLFEICSYFMMGLNLSAGRFFSYFIIMFFINMTMNGYFRFFGTVTTSFFKATQFAGIMLISTFIYTGYVIPYNSMHPWLFWIYWINPLAYGYKALLINEMHGQIYTCEGAGNAVPFGPGYDDWTHKVCTMQGGNPGENFVLGDNYLRKYLSYEPRHQWAPDFVALVGFFIVITILNSILMEFFGTNKGGSLTKLYLPGKAPKPRTKEEETERRRRQMEVSTKMDNISTGTTFTWQHINYSVPFKGGPLQLLNDVSGIVRPGHLTALMGSSGAGKTTLLDVLARRKTIGKVEGRVYLNNEALMNDFERITGYCEQMDIHQPAVTVREAMRFSAYLRQDKDIPQSEKDEYVEQIIRLLEMEDIADAQIGDVDHGVGISIEERKRLTIGMELVAKPKLLFLDEPTSGLDAQSSYNIIRFIRKLADAGWPVLCTIHQPSAILFEHFDHLLLLVRGGRTAYHGEIGPDARTMIDYFESNGGPQCAPDANPAEYILEVVGAGTAGKSKRDWADVWANSKEAKRLNEELDAIHQSANQNPDRKALTYATGFWYQFYIVHKRMALVYWRSPDYNIGRFMTLMYTSLFNGFTFWKMTNSTTDMQNRLFVLFNTFIMANILIILAQPKFMVERLFFRREYASRFYGWAPFAFTSILVEIPYIIVLSAFFMCGMYWTAGLVNTSETAGYFYLMLIIFVFWSVTLGFNIASIAEIPTMAAVINPLIISILILFAGLMQTVSAMPRFWSAWMYWLNPFHYFVEGLATNELHSIDVRCNENDFVKFTPPTGQTCGEYMAPYLTYGPGYVDNPNATDLCNYCTYKSGTEFYTLAFEWDVSHKWRNLGIIAGFFGFNMIVFLGLVYWKRTGRR
ncbi:ABC-2 type transporter-domain-containing protein [Dichotomocladium elegans]|nr:ABC-2 type transporter-domain-containing protein [Dichotomocladium elegans]